MNRFTYLLLIFFCAFLNLTVQAQYTLSGTVRSTDDTTEVGITKVSLNHGAFVTTTDSSGKFEFTNLPDGEYKIHASSQYFKPSHSTITISGKNEEVNISLVPDFIMLGEVKIWKKRESDPNYMKGVESMGIYEGKKSEVIVLDKMVVNLATNNARQVYSRVAGLNIWENDGAGLQLSVGGRGLDPNRTSNFNVRQNGYDISADALGYPESYYTPPVEGLERIQIVRGAASLQYGTQFGGLLNFVMRKPVSDKKIQLVARQSFGSFGFYNSFTSLSGTIGKVSYYSFFQYKKADGWRANSHFDNINVYTNLNYKFSKRTSIGVDVTVMDYLAQQPGGLTDAMFEKDPQQSNRERNWFKVRWNMMAIHFNHKFNLRNEFNLRVFGLSALRNSIGFRPYRVETADLDDPSQGGYAERDLIKGDFQNWGAEARYLKRYVIGNRHFVLLAGTRYYHGFNHATQGWGSRGKDANFNYNSDNLMIYDYRFPNRNVAAFVENIVYLHEKFSITPGVRYEYIHTKASGFYGNVLRDLAGNLLNYQTFDEHRNNKRQFVLAGIGFSYKPTSTINLYANISQNYRSITFSDMRITNPSAVIDPDMKDEKGYSADLGIRSEQTKVLTYDVSLFYLNYNNRIGEVQTYDKMNRIIRKRGNIGRAVISGVETFGELDAIQLFAPESKKWIAAVFCNTAYIVSEYVSSEELNVEGKQVEFVPKVNTKTGVKLGYKNFKIAYQYTYLSDQYADATNEEKGGVAAVVGLIPAYAIMDLSASYEYKIFKLEGSVNNLGNAYYYTRRATGYPGPGILPSDGRGYYVTLQVKI